MKGLSTVSKSAAGHKEGPVYAMDSAVLLWYRSDLPREAARSYWRGGHAQIVARNPALSDYRQHHFAYDSNGLWPNTDAVETIIPRFLRVDGMPEVRLKGRVSLFLNNQYSKKILSDEVNVFARTILYITSNRGGAWFKSGYDEPVGFRCVALIKRKKGISGEQFERFISQELCTVLNQSMDILELRSQVFLEWNQRQWDSPGVAHDNAEDDQYHAAVIIGARSKADLLHALDRVTDGDFPSRQAWFCSAIHAYEVESTYTYCREGRPTLPQLAPARKATIEPLMRAITPATERAAKSSSEQKITKAIKLPISGSTPEDVIVDTQGRLICGVSDGRILRIDPVTRLEVTLCSTGGRPLGLELTTDNRLIICDAHKGLLSFDFQTQVLVPLVEFVNTFPLRFCSNATIAKDGTIWFTESTSRFDFEQAAGAFIEHRPSGRLLRRDPNGEVTVVLSELYFPNGLSLNDDESAVLFVETAAYRLSRLWVRGEREGDCEVLADNFPGLPDNMSRIKNGRFWVAMVSPRIAALDSFANAPVLFRKLIWALPQKIQPKPAHTAWVMCFDQEGRLLEDLQSSDLSYSEVTSVAELNGRLYLGTVASNERSLLEIGLESCASNQINK